MEISVDKIPAMLKNIYCLDKPIYKSSSSNRKFNCRCDNCKKWNTLRNFYRKNTNNVYKKNQLLATKKWKKNNLENGRRSEAKRRAVYHEPYTESEVLDKYGSSCHICSKPIDLHANRSPGRYNWEYGLHIDHLVPIAKGGIDTIENVRPSHGICNIKKGAR